MLYNLETLKAIGAPLYSLHVALDDQLLTTCVAFDIEHGVVYCYRRDDQGKFVTMGDSLAIERLTGRVKVFFLDPGTGIGMPWQPPRLN